MMQSFLIIANALTVLAALVLAFSLLNRYDASKFVRQAGMGVMFGFCALLSLLQPMPIDMGVQIDGRNLFIAFAGAISGVIGAVIALGISGITRALIGGIGVWPGLISMVFCALMGLLWSRLDRRHAFPRRWRWIVFGVMISASIPILLLVPYPTGWHAFSIGGPFLFVIYMAGAMLLGFLFDNERSYDVKRRDLVKHSETDPLTGTLNRRGLFKRFHQAVASNGSRGIAVIMLDLNDFKILNDQFGHDIGDRALLRVVSKVISNIRSNDLFARLGGDEFAICAFGMTSQQAEKLITKLREKLIFELELEDIPQTANFTVSVGGAFSDAVVPDLDQLLASADKEMMSFKRSARHDHKHSNQADVRPTR